VVLRESLAMPVSLELRGLRVLEVLMGHLDSVVSLEP